MRPAYLPAVIPIAAFLIGPFFLNRATPFILGMPLLLGFITVTVVATSVIMAAIHHFEGRGAGDGGDEAAGGRP